MHPSRRFCHFLKCIPEVMFSEGLSTAYDSASIILFESKCRPFCCIFNWGNREKKGEFGMTVMLFLVKKSLVKKEV
jgi:hypothetical protein